MASIINKVLGIYRRVFSNAKLEELEKVCLEAWMQALPDCAKVILRMQLDAPHFLQRQALGAKVCFYFFNGKSLPLFGVLDTGLHAATVTLETGMGASPQRMAVKIFLNRGLIFSIEFPKRPERYLQQHAMLGKKLNVERVELHCDV
jgi:hypothetical protein